MSSGSPGWEVLKVFLASTVNRARGLCIHHRDTTIRETYGKYE